MAVDRPLIAWSRLEYTNKSHVAMIQYARCGYYHVHQSLVNDI